LKNNLTILLLSFFWLVPFTGYSQQAESFVRKGNHQYHQQQFDAAAEWYNRSLEIRSDALTLFNLGNALYRKGDYTGAISKYQEAIALANNPSAKKDAWYNLGNAYIKNRQPEEAINAYKEALRIDPDDADVRNNLQKALMERKSEVPQPQNNQNQKKSPSSSDNQKKSNEPQKLSKKMMEQYLESMRQKEEEVLRKIQQQKQKYQTREGKDW